jgi:hypothetical protein
MKITSSSCAKNCYAEWVVGTGNGGAQENTITPDGCNQKHGKELPTMGAAAQSVQFISCIYAPTGWRCAAKMMIIDRSKSVVDIKI